MRKKDLRRSGKIAVGFFAFLLLSVLIPANCLAASSSGSTAAEVVYAGDGTTPDVQTLNAANLDTFQNLMPGGSTTPQDIRVENRSSRNMGVYFQAQPTDSASVKLLDALQLKVTFKMDESSVVSILYEGPASGKNGFPPQSDIVTSPMKLGYVYSKSTSGIISATLTAPETMTNGYELAKANLKWTIQFEGVSPTPESIGNESTPLAPPDSGGGKIPNEGVPLSRPPQTGQSSLIPVFVVGGAALLLFLVFLIRRRKTE